jgi:hypothetical protein
MKLTIVLFVLFAAAAVALAACGSVDSGTHSGAAYGAFGAPLGVATSSLPVGSDALGAALGSSAPTVAANVPLGDGDFGDGDFGDGDLDVPLEYSAPSSSSAPAGSRAIRINGQALDSRGLQTLAALEAQYRTQLPNGDYWYDPTSGGAGQWGGPGTAILPAGLVLGGPLPPNASGGGNGQVTGVFINGRELHPTDFQNLVRLVGAAVPAGRYWVDAQGNAGVEGGPALGNLYAAARQRAGSGGRHTSYYDPGIGGSGSIGLASDGSTNCVNTAEYTRCYGPGGTD